MRFFPGVPGWTSAAFAAGALTLDTGVAPVPTAAADGATHSSPSATAPSSDGDRASGGATNGVGDPKGPGKAVFNRAPSPTHPEDATSSGATNAPGGVTAPNAAAGMPAKRPLDLADRRRLRQLAQVHFFEVDLAALATAISTNMAVRAYAVRMLEDHGNALSTLRRLASQLDVALPGGVESTNAAVLRNLAVKTGAQFDAEYLAQAGSGLQQQETALFAATRDAAGSADLKAYAGSQLALLRRHVQLAGKLPALPGGSAGMQATGPATAATAAGVTAAAAAGAAANPTASEKSAGSTPK